MSMLNMLIVYGWLGIGVVAAYWLMPRLHSVVVSEEFRQLIVCVLTVLLVFLPPIGLIVLLLLVRSTTANPARIAAQRAADLKALELLERQNRAYEHELDLTRRADEQCFDVRINALTPLKKKKKWTRR